MPVRTLIKPSQYFDSVTLMLAARQLARYPGVVDAAIVMATEANKALLAEAGLATPELLAATPNDLAIAIDAAEESLEAALAEAERLLRREPVEARPGEGLQAAAFRPRSTRSACRSHPQANVAVISVPGRYAAGEAWQALRQGLHVLLFSDNVSLEDEVALKRYACQQGLLLMGPGAGTAYLNGVGLGFANALPAGPIGVVSAAGSGLQEVASLMARNGVGLTQGIGAGGRDLSEAVGGLTMLAGLQALQEDPATQAIVLVSKPPAAAVAEKALAQVASREKPTVVCFLGENRGALAGRPNVIPAGTLQEAALLAARLGGAHLPEPHEALALESAQLEEKARELRQRLAPTQRYLRGLFSGGTLCYEAQVIWNERLEEPVLSNAPLPSGRLLSEAAQSSGHTALDLGEEQFTVGRLHPMIDQDLRVRRLLKEAHDPEVAVVVLDTVLGFGAHPDPAAELGPAVRQARRLAAEAGRELLFVGSVTGTNGDPQGLERQVRQLEEAGVAVCESNAAAARLAASIVGARRGGTP